MSRLPDGWLNDNEADELRRLATAKVVLELGAWKGRSTIVLAETARLVISIDKHGGISVAADSGSSLDQYLANIKGIANIIPIIGDWNQVVPFLVPVFGLVYVDGNHDAESAESDLLLASEFSCTIAAHDWDFDSVQEGASGAGFREPDRVVGSVAVWL